MKKKTKCVLTDSGTVQEECCIFNIANLTIRDVTERPETIECGSNILSGSDLNVIENNIGIAINNKFNWNLPDEYKEENVSSKVLKIVNSFYL